MRAGIILCYFHVNWEAELYSSRLLSHGRAQFKLHSCGSRGPVNSFSSAQNYNQHGAKLNMDVRTQRHKPL